MERVDAVVYLPKTENDPLLTHRSGSGGQLRCRKKEDGPFGYGICKLAATEANMCFDP